MEDNTVTIRHRDSMEQALYGVLIFIEKIELPFRWREF
jgi:glycyl-tRNA synthetase (class II)